MVHVLYPQAQATLGCIVLCVRACWNYSVLLTLCNSMDCSPPASSVHGILQARILVWVATPFSRGLPHPGIQALVSCIASEFFTAETQGSLGNTTVCIYCKKICVSILMDLCRSKFMLFKDQLHELKNY